jgi:hypothetical protein
MQLSLKPDKNNEYVTLRSFHIYENISLNYFTMRSVLQHTLYI